MCTTLLVADPELKVSRLGKFDSTPNKRSRPIKVVFSSEANVISTLKKLKKLKLKSIQKFAKISIFRDRTPMQIKIYNDVKTELNNRLQNGESNLKIKFIKGIPNIISSLN